LELPKKKKKKKKKKKTLRILLIIHVSKLESYFEDNFGRIQQPPLPIIINNEEEYEVEKKF